jgi:hypothetical protein
MRNLFRAAVLVALSAVLAGCDLGGGGNEKSAVDEAQVVVEEFVPKFQQPGEAEEGARAGLSALGRRQTRVVIEMDGDFEPLLRAEIRYGNCDVVTSARVYLLNDVKQGKSETVVDVPLGELREGSGYLILVRRLNEPSEFAGLCGDIALAEEN